MARYYFDLHDGFRGLDRQGAECSDQRAARDEADRRFRSMVDVDPDWFATGQTWHMDVIAPSGGRLLTIHYASCAPPNLAEPAASNRPPHGQQVATRMPPRPESSSRYAFLVLGHVRREV